MFEMRQSISLIIQSISMLTNGLLNVDNSKITPPSKYSIKTSMESLIHHFKYFSEGFHIRKSHCYVATEAPKGETGVYLICNNTNRPYRCKIRTPGFAHLQGLHSMTIGHLIADLVAIIGTLDIVFGEVDR